jgi:hypothetical protein
LIQSYEAQVNARPANHLASLSKRVLQRKSEKCGNMQILQHSSVGMQPQSVPSLVSEVLRSPGQPLDRGTRAFFEPRFGYDFSRVRVHADSKATESARSLRALAFAAGQNVVFGAGRYSPHTTNGRQLLGHELAHVAQKRLNKEDDLGHEMQVQIGSSSFKTIYRASDESFRVMGLYERRADHADTIFFDWDQPDEDHSVPEEALDSEEAEKATAMASSMIEEGVDTITLYGYASEEGSEAYNLRLVERRLRAVKNILKSVFLENGFTANINSRSELSKSRRQINYRFWRSVEMRMVGGRSHRGGARSTEPRTCDSTSLGVVSAARDSALQLINGSLGAIARLQNYIRDPSTDENVAIALDNNFGEDHSASNATAVRDQINSMKHFLERPTLLNTITKCGSAEGDTCRSGAAAMYSQRECRLTLCPGFFGPDYEGIRDEVLIHESGHAIGLGPDRAYRRERVILFLTRDQALRNTESYAIFLLELGRERPLVGPAERDVVTGCDPGSSTGMGVNERLVREALAWAQRWNTYAVFGTDQSYEMPQLEAQARPFIIQRFGRADRGAIAGIYDRYSQMKVVFGRQLRIRCVSDTDPQCSSAASCGWQLPDAVIICPSFLRISDLNGRIIEIYAQLARQMPGVEDDQAEAYPNLARDYMINIWRAT